MPYFHRLFVRIFGVESETIIPSVSHSETPNSMKIHRILPFLLLGLLAACSSNRDKELLDKANYAFQAKNIAEATTLYEQIVNDYPDSPSAPKALYALGSIYQTDPKNAAKALDAYEKIATQFPKDSLAPRSVFVCGFLAANVLNDTAKARKYYDRYLAEFAAVDSNITRSVRLELANLGKTPEQVLQELQNTANAQSANGHRD